MKSQSERSPLHCLLLVTLTISCALMSSAMAMVAEVPVLSIRPGQTVHHTLPTGDSEEPDAAVFELAAGTSGEFTIEARSVEFNARIEVLKALYEGRLSRGLGSAEAVREASLKMLRDRRARGRSTAPFYWAGFVAAGEWR